MLGSSSYVLIYMGGDTGSIVLAPEFFIAYLRDSFDHDTALCTAIVCHLPRRPQMKAKPILIVYICVFGGSEYTNLYNQIIPVHSSDF